MSKAQDFKNHVLRTISLDEAIKVAPAIAATSPHPRIKSPKYAFTNTVEIVDNMDRLGFQLTSASQSRSKNEMFRDYGTHILRFASPELYIKDSDGQVEGRPEVVFINDHAGNRPVQFEMGIFRLVCENGLVIKSQDFGSFRERHTKYDFDTIKRMIGEKVGGMKKVVNTISQWNGKLMSEKERFQFAVEALALRMGQDRQPEQYELFEILQPKRDADKGNSLWRTFNIVQENLIKGGYEMNNRTARAITNPMQGVKINQDLWQLAEAYAN